MIGKKVYFEPQALVLTFSEKDVMTASSELTNFVNWNDGIGWALGKGVEL